MRVAIAATVATAKVKANGCRDSGSVEFTPGHVRTCSRTSTSG